MTKKHDRNSARKVSDFAKASTDKSADKSEEQGETPKVEFDLGLGGFLGGLFGGIEKIIDLAEKAEAAGGTLRKEGKIRDGSRERPLRGVYGFTIRTGLGQERSRVETFGNIRRTKQGPRVVETREPLVDVFDEPHGVTVIVELPGVEEKDIKLDGHGDILHLETTGEKKYAKEILLPAKVDFATKAMNFKNGILELKLRKLRKT